MRISPATPAHPVPDVSSGTAARRPTTTRDSPLHRGNDDLGDDDDSDDDEDARPAATRRHDSRRPGPRPPLTPADDRPPPRKPVEPQRPIGATADANNAGTHSLHLAHSDDNSASSVPMATATGDRPQASPLACNGTTPCLTSAADPHASRASLGSHTHSDCSPI